MSDLISRQATIDALTHKWDGMVTSVFDVVNSLPSAQPAIIHCRDCKHLFKDNKCPLRTWWTHTEDDFCSKGERRTDESD